MSKKGQALDRYSRQIVFSGVGREGQEKMGRSSVVVVGCGALGCNIANLLVRGGVGRVRIVDRDFVEYHNLQRQTLFDEADVRSRIPKAIAAQRHLQEANSLVDVEAIVADVNFSNAERLCSGMDVIVDGLDNLGPRYLINDVSLKLGIPYVYGGAISSFGMTMTVIPGKTACLRCVFGQLAPFEAMPTCETAGVLASAAAVIGALEATETMKLLVGSEQVSKELVSIDVWDIAIDRFAVERLADCPACGGRYDFLNKSADLIKSSLCGQARAIQIVDTRSEGIDFEKLARRLEGVDNLTFNEHMMSFEVEELTVLVFPDGRAIVRNTLDEDLAERLYRKYVGFAQGRKASGTTDGS